MTDFNFDVNYSFLDMDRYTCIL